MFLKCEEFVGDVVLSEEPVFEWIHHEESYLVCTLVSIPALLGHFYRINY